MTDVDLLRTLQSDVRAGAIALLGAELIRGELRARIVETEAYRGADDPGSHAHRGPTPRCEAMFGPAGFAYVYFTYGMHWMLNVSALGHDEGAAVLIRSAIPISGIESMRERRPKAKSDQQILSGPACLCTAFGIDRAQYGVNLFDPSSELRIVAGVPPQVVLHGPRVGLAPGKGDKTRWRFAEGESMAWVSRPHRELVPLTCLPQDIPPSV